MTERERPELEPFLPAIRPDTAGGMSMTMYHINFATGTLDPLPEEEAGKIENPPYTPPAPPRPTPEWVDAADTAKLIRATLKRELPGKKFSVRTRRYAGGSSVNVSWTGGPSTATVDALIAGFMTKGFDGMVDCGYNGYAWLTPNGEAVPAGGPCDGQGGRLETPPPPEPGSRLVSFPSYVFTHRSDRAPEDATA